MLYFLLMYIVIIIIAIYLFLESPKERNYHVPGARGHVSLCSTGDA